VQAQELPLAVVSLNSLKSLSKPLERVLGKIACQDFQECPHKAEAASLCNLNQALGVAEVVQALTKLLLLVKFLMLLTHK